jgi:hypothetical protein
MFVDQDRVRPQNVERVSVPRFDNAANFVRMDRGMNFPLGFGHGYVMDSILLEITIKLVFQLTYLPSSEAM